ncbi:MAG: hypothetical protein JW808_11195 [Victivallales bacterium]|nr:hypothetical protein [Victivallales bacterium]
MYKILMVSVVLLFFSLDCPASDPEDRSWDFFGVVFIPGVPSSSNDTDIGGFRVGLPIAGGLNTVCGIEFAAACCWTREVFGVQTAPLFCISENLTGLQASPVNMAEKVAGVQFGLVNVCNDASFQLGLVNFNESGILPVTIIANWGF